MDIKELDKKYIANTYNRFALNLVSGKGAFMRDEQGKEYIDLASGIAVNTFGAADKEWVQAVTDQLTKLQHASNLYYTEPCVTLAKMLCERTGMKKVFFSNSGAEANECAIKAARRRAFLKYGENHSTIVTLKNSFHGRTITTLAATGQECFHTEFGPFTGGFVYATPNDLESVKILTEENKCAAVMIEIVQGEGGVMPLEQDFVKGIAKLCEEKDILLIVDEVQTGNGRTGKLYGYMNFDINPDIVSTAKGLAGGLPLGATMLGEKAQDAFVAGTHGSTFGGNPIAAAGAINILSRLDDETLQGVRDRSNYIVTQLKGAKGVKSVDGMGLMLGIATERPAKEVIAKAMEKGVLVISAKDKVRLLPPLNIEMNQLKKAIEILKEVVAE